MQPNMKYVVADIKNTRYGFSVLEGLVLKAAKDVSSRLRDKYKQKFDNNYVDSDTITDCVSTAVCKSIEAMRERMERPNYAYVFATVFGYARHALQAYLREKAYCPYSVDTCGEQGKEARGDSAPSESSSYSANYFTNLLPVLSGSYPGDNAHCLSILIQCIIEVDLNERQRRIATLYYYGGLTMREVGECVSLSVERVNQILVDCRKIIRRRLLEQ